MSESTLKTALFDSHVALGARMVPFAGYEMPVQYQSIIAETKAVRAGAGMFDVGHMARLRFQGDRVIEYLEWITANDVAKLEDGFGQYSMLPNPQGGIVDDIIVYRVNATEFRMVVNASNHAKDVEWMQSQNKYGVTMQDETDATGMIAVQGPTAASLVANLCGQPGIFDGLPFFGTKQIVIGGIPIYAPRSGYTGEDGFELICPADDAPALWDILLKAGVEPCGLAARDALRVEAGLPLYGHELADDLSPIAAGLGWAISKTKGFMGSEFPAKDRAEGTATKLQGIRMASRRLPSPGMSVFVSGERVGEVTSGVFSPLLDCGVAFAFVSSAVPQGTDCEVDIRGKMEPGTIVNKRFFKREK